jgi:hypothetical protein
MIAELDYDLTPNQWETLRALRRTVLEHHALNTSELEQLVALQLAEMVDGSPVLTSVGRKVLVRGSSRLLDLAA